MLDMSKAIITLDTSAKTLAAVERRIRYSCATDEERRKLADAEQHEWDKKYLKGILMPEDKPTLRFYIRRWFLRLQEKLT